MNASTAVTTTTTASPWAFLSPWFARLRGRIELAVDGDSDYASERDVLFRDPRTAPVSANASACWLRVELLPLIVPWDVIRGRRDNSAEGVARELRQIRDALLMVARAREMIPYAAWLHHLTTSATMHVPWGIDMLGSDVPIRFDLDCTRVLALRHEFRGDRPEPPTAADRRRVADDAWEAALGYDEFSTEFRRDHARLVASMALPSSMRLAVPLRLHFELQEDLEGLQETRAIEDLEYLSATIRRIQSMAPRAAIPHATLPAFQVASLDLDLKKCGNSAEVIRATRELMTRCRVPLRSLTLPRADGCYSISSLEDDWSRFVGFVAGCEPASVPVMRLCFGFPYSQDVGLHVPLFCALAHARGVDEVVIDDTRANRFMYGNMTCPSTRQATLSWAAHALLASSSTSSVTKLHLKLSTLTKADVAAMNRIAKEPKALARLWKKTHHGRKVNLPTISDGLGTITIAAGTTVTCYTTFSRKIQIPSSVTGTIVWEDEAQSVQHVLLPGYGFAMVENHDLDLPRAAKRRRVAVAQQSRTRTVSKAVKQLDKLTVDLYGDVDANDGIQALIRMVGASLTEMRVVAATPINEASVDAMLTHCKQLHQLHLVNAQLGSMDVFARAYERDLPLESLSLEGGQIAADALHPFLELLGKTGGTKAQRRLRCLRFGWSESAVNAGTFGVLDRMLKANNRLLFLEVHLKTAVFEETDSFNHTHSRRVVAKPLTPRARWAAVGVLRCNAKLPVLDSDAVAIILAFAARIVPRTARVVKAEPHTNRHRFF